MLCRCTVDFGPWGPCVGQEGGGTGLACNSSHVAPIDVLFYGEPSSHRLEFLRILEVGRILLPCPAIHSSNRTSPPLPTPPHPHPLLVDRSRAKGLDCTVFPALQPARRSEGRAHRPSEGAPPPTALPFTSLPLP